MSMLNFDIECPQMCWRKQPRLLWSRLLRTLLNQPQTRDIPHFATCPLYRLIGVWLTRRPRSIFPKTKWMLCDLCGQPDPLPQSFLVIWHNGCLSHINDLPPNLLTPDEPEGFDDDDDDAMIWKVIRSPAIHFIRSCWELETERCALAEILLQLVSLFIRIAANTGHPPTHPPIWPQSIILQLINLPDKIFLQTCDQQVVCEQSPLWPPSWYFKHFKDALRDM